MRASAPEPVDTPWVADRSVVWWVGLTATLDAPPSPTELLERVCRLASDRGWTPPTEVEIGDDPLAVLVELCTRPPTIPARVGLAGSSVVFVGQHSHVDGLGMLAVLAAVTGQQVTSSARGLGDRSERDGVAAGTARRLREALLRPPARVARSSRVASDDRRESVVARRLDGTYSISDLVAAGAAGIAAYNDRHGRPTRRIAVAVGASRRPGTAVEAENRSALLRLRDVEGLSRAQVREALRAASPEPDPSTAGGVPLLGTAMAVGMRALAPRLGSTLLASHLGTVTGAGVHDVLIYPVTAGGSGISLGAADDGGRTLVSLRARARQYDDDALEEILEGIVAELLS